MSASSQNVDVLKPKKSNRDNRKILDEILVIADDLLKDECPISQVDEWLFRIDDALLQLKLWRETVGIEQGLLEDIVLDKDLCLVIGEVLRSVILPLHNIEAWCEWCEDRELIKSPQIKSRISAAIDEFQNSINSLTDTIELFRNYYKAKSDNQSFLQDLKPDYHQTRDLSQKAVKEQRIRELRFKRVENSSYAAFQRKLDRISDKERQVIRFGELPILRRRLEGSFSEKSFRTSDGSIVETDEVSEVAAILSGFYAAWSGITNATNSDAISSAHGLPHMAKIWLILHEMGQEHLLDSFCASRITDESIPLDILTLESIIPLDESMHPSMFASLQFKFVPGPVGYAPPYQKTYFKGSAPLDGAFLGPSEAPSGNLSTVTLSGVSSAGTITPTGDPPVEETALNQSINTNKAFAHT